MSDEQTKPQPDPADRVNDNGRPTWYEQRVGDAYPHITLPATPKDG